MDKDQDDNASGRAARAEALRRKISEIKSEADEEASEDSTTKPEEKESPRDFVERKMREDKKDRQQEQ